MKPKLKKWNPEGDIDTPYKRASQEWDDRIGSSVKQARSWRYAAFSSFLLVAMSIIGMFYLGSLPKMVPHIVEVHADGSATYRGVVGNAWENFTPDKTSIRYHLARFIEDTRNVSRDPAIIKKNWLDAYTLVTPSASNTLSMYAEKNDPFKRAKEERVSIEIKGMVPISEDSWQTDWTEIGWDKRGNVIGTTFWKGVFRITLQKPKNEQQLRANPIGLYISEFNWAQVER